MYTLTNFVFSLQGTQKWTKRRSIHFQKTTKRKKVCPLKQRQKSRTSSALQRITSLSPVILNCCDIHSRKSCTLRRCSECPMTHLFLSKPFQACSLLFGNPMWGGISRQQFISSYCTSRWRIWSFRNPNYNLSFQDWRTILTTTRCPRHYCKRSTWQGIASIIWQIYNHNVAREESTSTFLFRPTVLVEQVESRGFFLSWLLIFNHLYYKTLIFHSLILVQVERVECVSEKEALSSFFDFLKSVGPNVILCGMDEETVGQFMSFDKFTTTTCHHYRCQLQGSLYKSWRPKTRLGFEALSWATHGGRGYSSIQIWNTSEKTSNISQINWFLFIFL